VGPHGTAAGNIGPARLFTLSRRMAARQKSPAPPPRRRAPLGDRLGSDHTLHGNEILAAIDVGSNAVRLKLARLLDDGSFDQLHQERDPVRPGEGIWDTGRMPDRVVDRLVVTLRRYADVCRQHRVKHLRAVATSAVREAKNRDEVVARVREECGVELEVIPGREEARLIGLGVLRGLPATARSLLIDIGAGSTEVVRGVGEEPTELWSLPLGAVRLGEIFQTNGKLTRERLVAMRRFAQRVVAEHIPKAMAGPKGARHAMGSSGTVRAVCAFAASPGSASASRPGLTRAVEELVRLSPAERRMRFDAARAEIIIGGAVVLESLAHHLRLDSVTAVDGGLKEGLLVDLVRRARQHQTDPLLSEALIAVGRRFGFDEEHAVHTREVALSLFDKLAEVHHLPADCRPILETAAMLHDVGYLVSQSRHHKHSQYLIENMDLPGLSDGERKLAALTARFHRRSPPDKDHPALTSASPLDRRVVRGLATLLRIADGVDHSRQQPVAKVQVRVRGPAVEVSFERRAKRAFESWDHEAERALFRSCFGKRLELRIPGLKDGK
jgi:exopolyphosphatase / guanosine-5'-triphosphate,3'-diphosphate pyrophosphatase